MKTHTKKHTHTLYMYIRTHTYIYHPHILMYIHTHSRHLLYMHAHVFTTLSQKNARTCAHKQRCRSFFAMKLLRTYFESFVDIVQAVVCRPPSCWLDEISCPTLFAQEIRPNLRQLMTRSPLRCRTSIIRSSALVRASSSLSMVHTRAWLTLDKVLFSPLFSRAFDFSCILLLISKIFEGFM